jgi:hypothetical protein
VSSRKAAAALRAEPAQPLHELVEGDHDPASGSTSWGAASGVVRKYTITSS